MHGFCRSNIDYRVKAFLCQPEQYQLVVEDYYAADLFRSRGHRGATYLFLRWCVSQYGPNLIPGLVGSKLRGIANLEEATGCSFADLYRRWSVSLCQAEHEHKHEQESSGPAAPGQASGDRTNETRTHVEEWQLAGPRKSSLTSGGPAENFRVAGTSSHFAVVRSSSAGNVEITVRGPTEALLQVTVIPAAGNSANLDSPRRHTALLTAIFGSAPGCTRSRESLFESRRWGGSPLFSPLAIPMLRVSDQGCSMRLGSPPVLEPTRCPRATFSFRDQSGSRAFTGSPGRWFSG